MRRGGEKKSTKDGADAVVEMGVRRRVGGGYREGIINTGI